MCYVPAGSFWMGCNSEVDTECFSAESPYHEVTLSGYYIDRTEVTRGEYKKCVDTGVCDTPASNGDPLSHPNQAVDYVDWVDATAYCAWVGKRLPTEAEWEKAARGTDGRKYPWGNGDDATCEYAVMYDGTSSNCGSSSLSDVCSKSPAGDSPYGLCDMAGNVSEWVSDWYCEDYYSSSPASNPMGPDSGLVRVVRGGALTMYYGHVRASHRYNGGPSDIFSYGYVLGFRCAKDAQ